MNSFYGHATQVLKRRKAVIGGAHKDVIYVEQDPSIRASDDLTDEIPFRERACAVLDVARHVLEQQLPTEAILHPLHPFDHVKQRLFRVRQRPQIVRIVTTKSTKAQVVRDAQRADARGQLSELAQVARVQWIEPTDG